MQSRNRDDSRGKVLKSGHFTNLTEKASGRLKNADEIQGDDRQSDKVNDIKSLLNGSLATQSLVPPHMRRN